MNNLENILKEVEGVLSKVDSLCISKFADIIGKGNRIFVVGEGRSGLMGKSFAMRLMHLGATVYVVGETITPALMNGDVLVAISGSGTTQNVVMVAQKAVELKCQLLVMTTNPTSKLGNLASLILHIPAATKYRRTDEPASIQPLGSLFDQCAHIVFDAICLEYYLIKSEDNNEALARHSNLE